jgi:hypothetical protein
MEGVLQALASQRVRHAADEEGDNQSQHDDIKHVSHLVLLRMHATSRETAASHVHRIIDLILIKPPYELWGAGIKAA